MLRDIASLSDCQYCFNTGIVDTDVIFVITYMPCVFVLRELIEHVCSQKSGLVILGDFNVHYGSSGDNDACMLADILHSTNFQQHVSSATHCRGNILDLVITPSTNSVITDVSVESLMTDHKCHNVRYGVHKASTSSEKNKVS